VALPIVDFGRGVWVKVERAFPNEVLVCGVEFCVDWERRFLRAHALVDKLRDVSQLPEESQKRYAVGIGSMVCVHVVVGSWNELKAVVVWRQSKTIERKV